MGLDAGTGELLLSDAPGDAAGDSFRRALAALGTAGGQHQERAALLIGLGEALRRSGDTVAARQAFLDAARHARSVGDGVLLGEAALGYGLGAGGLHRALRCDLQHIALLEEALSALGAVETPLRVRLLARLAEELYFTPETAARQSLCGEAVAMAQRMGDRSVLLPALHARELGHVGPDLPLEERISDAAELVALARELHDDEALYLGHMLRELAYVEAGRFEEGDPDLAAAEEVAERLGMSSLQAWAAASRARRLWLAGRFAEGEAMNADALRLATEQGGDPEVVNLVLGGQLLSMQLLRADLSAFVPALVAFRQDYPHFTILRCFTAYARVETGDLAAARHEFDELMGHDLADTLRNAEWPGTLWALSRTAVRLEDAAAAARVYAELAAASGRWCADWASNCLGPVDTCLGLLAGLMGRWDAAVTHLEQAVAQATRAPCPPWLADAQVSYGEVLLRRAGAGDGARARALLEDALTTCEQLGMDALGLRAKEVLSGA